MPIKKSKGLGKGLPNLFGVKSIADVLENTPSTELPQKLPIALIRPGRYQARKLLASEGIHELAESIREHGILNPIVVRRIGEEEYEILAGERRYRAAEQVGLEDVPVTVMEMDDETALVVGLIENLQREDLNAIEVAAGFQRLIDEFGFTHEKIAQSVGKSRSAVSNLLRLLNLPKDVQDRVRHGEIDMGHARALLSLSAKQQSEVAKLIVERQLSVRQIESLVENLNNAKEEHDRIEKKSENPRLSMYLQQLKSRFGRAVKIHADSSGKGKIQISFADEKELESVIQQLIDPK